MIISHTYRYLFVELPQTGSTAVSSELRANYDGTAILRKHATYHDFLKVASPREKNYFVFSGIRNPLDQAVSLYFKLKSDHRQKFSTKRVLTKQRRLSNYLAMVSFNYIRESDADFPTYFRRFYRLPYNDWSSMSHRKFDFLIRYEHLQDDFSRLLELLGIEQVRPLPVVNKTSGKGRDFDSYYTPDIIPHARRVFGPYMEQWGYDFPSSWGEHAVPWWNRFEYAAVNVFRQMYWRFVRAHI
jgi:hypothetical protein